MLQLQQVLTALPVLRSHHLPGALAGGGIARLQQSTASCSCDTRAFRALHTTSSSSDGSRDGRTTASSSTTTPAPPQQQPASSSSSTSSKPAMASGAGAAAAAATNAAKAAAKQASKLIKLVQATSLSEATRLQLSSTWAAHSAALTAAAGAAATAGVYLSAAAVAGQFGVDMSQPGAYLGCLSASAAAVTATGLHMRSRFTVDPDRVYRVALRKLARHAGLQEVMGAPIAGSETRLQLVTSGSLFVQETLLPRVRAPRIHMLFQLSGPVKSGVVSLEAAKDVGGKYRFKTLMVELPDKALAGSAAEAACEAAAAAAMARVRQAAAPATGPVATATTSSSSISSGGPSSSSSSQDSAGSSRGADAAAAADSSAKSTPARIYIVGGPASSSKGSSPAAQSQQLSTREVLEGLKDPLIYALKRNLVVYEAEDEFGGQLASSTQPLDPDQATWWDSGKAAAKHAACRAYSATRAGLQRLKAAAVAAQAARQKAVAAAAAAPAAPGSSKDAGPAAVQQQPSAPPAVDAAGSSSSDTSATSLPATSPQAAPVAATTAKA